MRVCRNFSFKKGNKNRRQEWKKQRKHIYRRSLLLYSYARLLLLLLFISFYRFLLFIHHMAFAKNFFAATASSLHSFVYSMFCGYRDYALKKAWRKHESIFYVLAHHKNIFLSSLFAFHSNNVWCLSPSFSRRLSWLLSFRFRFSWKNVFLLPFSVYLMSNIEAKNLKHFFLFNG